jgi:hypothetical protein
MPMLLSMAIVQLPLTLLSLPFIMAMLGMADQINQMSVTGNLNFDTFLLEHLDALVWGAVAMFGALAYQVMVMPLGNLACAKLASQALLNEPITFQEALRFALSQYWPTQVAIAVFLLPLLGLSVLALLFVLIANSANDPTGVAIAAGLGIIAISLGSAATGLLFFRLFPGINGIIPTMEEVEGETVVQKGMWLLRRSWDLTQGYYSRIFGFLFLLWIAVYMITKGVQDSLSLIAMFITQLGKLESSEQLMNSLTAPQDPLQTGIVLVISGLFTAVITPVWQCFKTLQYVDLRCRKEGLDLYMLLDEQPAELRSSFGQARVQ